MSRSFGKGRGKVKFGNPKVIEVYARGALIVDHNGFLKVLIGLDLNQRYHKYLQKNIEKKS